MGNNRSERRRASRNARCKDTASILPGQDIIPNPFTAMAPAQQLLMKSVLPTLWPAATRLWGDGFMKKPRELAPGETYTAEEAGRQAIIATIETAVDEAKKLSVLQERLGASRDGWTALVVSAAFFLGCRVWQDLNPALVWAVGAPGEPLRSDPQPPDPQRHAGPGQGILPDALAEYILTQIDEVLWDLLDIPSEESETAAKAALQVCLGFMGASMEEDNMRRIRRAWDARERDLEEE